ncbi:MAG: type II toxin-antitoxin system HicB family antitoxin [Burkholderiaceae bacterium]
MSPIKSIPAATPPHPFEAYTHVVSPITTEDGGGFMISLPDLPGCIADGTTEAEAIANGRDAFAAVIAALIDLGREVPAPSFRADSLTAAEASGKFLTRVPKSVHAQLARRATAEGVSLNALVLTFIAEGLGRHQHA